MPNPSFEFYTKCPVSGGDLPYAYPWFSTCGRCDYNGICGSSSELYNTCAVDSGWIPNALVPQNIVGYQYPRTGNGYAGAGISAYENLEIGLIKPLEKGKRYCVSFYISLANNVGLSIDAIGAYFSQDSILPLICGGTCKRDCYPNLKYTPQIANPVGNIISDTLNWVPISGSFVAEGGERIMTIASFRDQKNMKFKILTDDPFVNDSNVFSPNISSYVYAYYYFDDFSVYECDAPVFAANGGGNKIICKDDSVQIGTKGRDEYLYQWFEFRNLEMYQFKNDAQVWVKPDSTTTYILKQKDFKFDETVDTVVVTVSDPVVKVCTDTAICKGERVELKVNSEKLKVKYKWNTGDTNATLMVAPTITTTYTVLGTDTNGCSVKDSVTIKVNELPNAKINVVEQLNCRDNTLVLSAEGGKRYLWNTGDTIPTITQIIKEQAMTKSYTVTVTNDKGCKANAQITIDLCKEITVSNVITPNGDGKNDVFKVENLPDNSILEIFDRWGRMILKKSNYQNDWNGGNEAQGVYFYLLSLPDGEVRKGFFEIIK